jgi:TQXA domain-containing protein
MGRSHLFRAAAAVAGASVMITLSGAIPAAAETEASLDFQNTSGLPIYLASHPEHRWSTNLIGLGVNGKHLDTYCIELTTMVDTKHPDMTERPWDAYPNANSPFHRNRDKVNWVLHHSYPALDTDKIVATLGRDFNGGLSAAEAIAATQAAIWHFSDNAQLNTGKATDDAASSADILALYEYLIGELNTGLAEPKAGLEMTPDQLTGTAGDRIGPFTVTSTSNLIKVVSEFPAGVTLTDRDGNPLSTAAAEQKIKEQNRYDIFVQVPPDAAAGKGSFTLTIEAPVSTGRLYVGKQYQQFPTQTLIIVKSDNLTIQEKGQVEWSAAGQPAPTTTATTTTTTKAAPKPQAKNNDDDLAETGASIFGPVVIGLVLLGAGAGALIFLRRRGRV